MKPNPIEAFRVTLERAIRMKYPTEFATGEADGFNGMFIVPAGREFLRCIVSDGRHPEAQELREEERAWEHVSVSLASRCPTWAEMCIVKDAFWNEDEPVFQLHPPKSDYVNFHPHCLHLWRHRTEKLLVPPSILVGPLNRIS